MISKKDDKKIKELISAILLLKGVGEAKNFLRDLLTESELVEFSNRWKAARMLSEKISYVEVGKETGLSSTTVARVSKWLNTGKGGYKLMIKRIMKNIHHNNSFVGRGRL
jgi:TrpR-related protein YerC/YecD